MRRILNRHVLVNAAIAAAVSAGSVAGVSLAQGNGAPATPPAVSTPSVTAPPGGILAGVHDVLAQLVAAGTIDQSQADAVQAQANAGSIDPKQLVDSGALSDAQMHAVAAQIDALKRSYAP
jgi:hypothetical protein